MMAASYPGSVKTFTTKNAGDTIQPAHVNDLQDEVNAIESGLLNGTAPLTASNATLNTLSVSSNSTFTRSVQMSSNCTIAGTLTVTTIVSTSIPAANAVTSYVRAFPSAAFQFATASTGTKVALDSAETDLLSEWDTATYTFTPASSGHYLITASARCLTQSVANVFAQVWINDTLAGEGAAAAPTGSSGATPAVSLIANLSSGSAGAVQLRARVSASTGSFSSGVAYTHLDIMRIF